MVRTDYYLFYVYKSHKFVEECHKTLREAKQAYINHLKQGHRLGCDIYGCTLKEYGTSLTFTPWYSDVKAFGRTELTNIGYAVQIGKYILS